MTIRDFWDRSGEVLVGASYLVGFMCAISIVGWQIFHWLKTSEWQPIPFLAAFTYFEIDLSSVYAPSSWFGLAKVLQWILDLPLAIALPVSLALSAHAWFAFVSSGTAPNSQSAISK